MLGKRLANRLATATIRHRLRVEARRKGYTSEQSRRLVGRIGDGKIREKFLEFWEKYGSIIIAILKVIAAILPFLLLMEAPEGEPVVGQDELDAIELEEAGDELLVFGGSGLPPDGVLGDDGE